MMFPWSLLSFRDIIVVTHVVVRITHAALAKKNVLWSLALRRGPEDVIVLAEIIEGSQRNVVVSLNDQLL